MLIVKGMRFPIEVILVRDVSVKLPALGRNDGGGIAKLTLNRTPNSGIIAFMLT